MVPQARHQGGKEDMANTTYIKNNVEPFVRRWLESQFGRTFTEQSVELVGGGSHKFDAVSADTAVVGDILCNRPTTRTGNENTGGVRKAQNDIDYLKRLSQGIERVLVFTDASFYELIRQRSRRWGAGDVRMLVCPLPPDLERGLTAVLNTASREQRGAGE